jgi:hypothetical protein
MIDVYRVLALYDVTDPCIQHAVKKLLVAGGRGAGKDISQDIQEAIDSLERWKDMRNEENPPDHPIINIVNTLDTESLSEHTLAEGLDIVMGRTKAEPVVGKTEKFFSGVPCIVGDYEGAYDTAEEALEAIHGHGANCVNITERLEKELKETCGVFEGSIEVTYEDPADED